LTGNRTWTLRLLGTRNLAMRPDFLDRLKADLQDEDLSRWKSGWLKVTVPWNVAMCNHGNRQTFAFGPRTTFRFQANSLLMFHTESKRYSSRALIVSKNRVWTCIYMHSSKRHHVVTQTRESFFKRWKTPSLQIL
jgi:hypothetical protein